MAGGLGVDVKMKVETEDKSHGGRREPIGQLSTENKDRDINCSTL